MPDLVESADKGRIFLLDGAVQAFVKSATDEARRKFARACAKLAVERAFAGDSSNDKAVLRQALAAVGSSRVDLQACKLEYSIVSPK